MGIVSYASFGYEGAVVTVEVDIRRGIPGVHIVGLPDNAVREARERIHSAFGTSGMAFPRDRVLINLAPADVKKEGTAFDLPIAIAILIGSGGIRGVHSDIMILGELQLSGRIRPVRGVLPAVAAGRDIGIKTFIVPSENIEEACVLGYGKTQGVRTLRDAAAVVDGSISGIKSTTVGVRQKSDVHDGDFADIRGLANVRRGLEIAAAGRHHALLFGPPGGGKTMAALRFPTILPPLSSSESIELMKIRSIAGEIKSDRELHVSPPFRAPHHSSSLEGLVGGGTSIVPGEISLSHRGVLFLDEVPEFGKHLIQSLREPIETGRIVLSRAGSKGWFPADFQLLLACNVCPCANLGREDGICTCSRNEVITYWRRLGGSLMDRIDIRIPVKPIGPEKVMDSSGEASSSIKQRVVAARRIQAERYNNDRWQLNGAIPASAIQKVCRMSDDVLTVFTAAARTLSLSTRASHSVLKVARTISDLRAASAIEKNDILEAFQFRRFGDADIFWSH